jgi:hypothetical protein
MLNTSLETPLNNIIEIMKNGDFWIFGVRGWSLNYSTFLDLVAGDKIYMYGHVHKNFTSGFISLKKLYGRFQFQVKNTLHWTVQTCTIAYIIYYIHNLKLYKLSFRIWLSNEFIQEKSLYVERILFEIKFFVKNKINQITKFPLRTGRFSFNVYVWVISFV